MPETHSADIRRITTARNRRNCQQARVNQCTNEVRVLEAERDRLAQKLCSLEITSLPAALARLAEARADLERGEAELLRVKEEADV